MNYLKMDFMLLEVMEIGLGADLVIEQVLMQSLKTRRELTKGSGFFGSLMNYVATFYADMIQL